MVGGYALRYALGSPRGRRCDGDRPQADGPQAPETEGSAPSRLRGLFRTRRRALGPGRERSFVWVPIPARSRTQNSAESPWTTRSSSRECSAPAVPTRRLLFLSGSGADPTGRSRMAFARYKGEAEKALAAAGFPHVYMFRPAYIYPVQPRREPNFSYRLLRTIYPGISSVVSQPSDSCRRLGPNDGGCRRTGNRRRPQSGSGEP